LEPFSAIFRYFFQCFLFSTIFFSELDNFGIGSEYEFCFAERDVDALEHHCLPDPKSDLNMLGYEFAEFIDTDLEEEIAAGLPAQQQWPAGARQALPPAAAGAAAAAADPPPFGQLEHAAHPVPHAVFNDEEDAPCAPQMRLGQRPAGQGRRQRRMDAEATNGQYWDLRQPLPPAKLVLDAVAAENLHGQMKSTNNAEWSKKGS
jgi:hypothetical protein